MFTRSSFLLSFVAIVSLCLITVPVNAQEVITPSATVTVLNNFTFTDTQTLDFGTLSVIGDGIAGGTEATLSIAADGTVGAPVNGGAAADDAIAIITPGQRAIYNISGAAPNTAITVAITGSPVTLTDGTAPNFTVDSFVDDTTAGSVTTDGSGAATINVGATLRTDPDATAAYDDAVYSGTYTVTASY